MNSILPLETYLIELIATAAVGLQELRAASDDEYRATALDVAGRMEPYVSDTLLARCEFKRQ